MNKGGGFRGKTQSSTKVFNESVITSNFIKSTKNNPVIFDSASKKTIGSQSTLNKSKKPDSHQHLDGERSLFEQSYSEILRWSRDLYKYYPDDTEKKLEFEVRLSINSANVSYDYFIIVYNFLTELFPNVDAYEFEENASTQLLSKGYSLNTIVRTDKNTNAKDIYTKLKLDSINMAIVAPFSTRLGLSVEMPNINNSSSAAWTLKDRARWSFIVDESDMNKLPSFLQKIYKKDSGFKENEYRLKIDLTRTVFMNNGNPGGVIFEIEVELLDVDRPEQISPGILNFMDAWIKILATVASKEGEYVSHKQHMEKISKFNKIFNIGLEGLTEYMINNPTDLTVKDFSWRESSVGKSVFAFPGGCHVSLKADGTRHFIYFDVEQIHLMQLKKGTMTLIGKIEASNNELVGSVFDVELITDLNVYGLAKKYVFLAFDCLSFKGLDVRHEFYSARLSSLKKGLELFAKLNHPYIFIYFKETILLPGPESNDAERWFRIMSNFFDQNMEDNKIDFKKQQTPGGDEWEVDGYIITPEQKPYLDFVMSKGGQVKSVSWVRKWKTRITIDFQVKMNSSKKWGLYSPNLKRAEDANGIDRIVEVEYIPRGIVYVEIPQEELESYAYKIVECEWVFINELKGTFKILRSRSDRKDGNPLYIANLLMQAILKPIDREVFLDQRLKFMRAYHNSVKRELLGKYSGGPGTKSVLVDLGSGRGGDLSKWNAYSKVYAVEPDQKNLEELLRRNYKVTLNVDVEAQVESLEDFFKIELALQTQTLHFSNAFHRASLENSSKLKIINGSAEDVDFLLKNIPKNSADVITLFNVLTFFYKSTEMLDQLLTSVDNLIKDNGYFLVISLDGEKMNDLLAHRNAIKSKNLTISRTDETNKIWIEIFDGIVRGQFEYLTRLEEFSMLLKARGYSLEDSYYLEGEPFLSQESFIFSSLFKVLVFKKGVNPRQNQLKNSLRWLLQKDDMERPIRMLSPEERPVHIKSKYFESNGVINLYRFGVIGDGSCYIHAILRSMSKSYKAMSINEKAQFVKTLRENLSNNYTIQEHNSIGDGFFRDSKLPEYSYLNMKTSLRKLGSSVSHEMLSFIGDQLNVNVYLIRGNQEAAPYNFGKEVSHIKPGRHNILLFWINSNHYEAVGQIKGNMVQFVFEDNDPILKLF